MESPEPITDKTRKSPSKDAERTTYVRLLVSNAEAGSVIGKGGSTINDFQSQSGARIQLSRSHETFPGTPDRILMVSGTINVILKAMDLILAKFLNELHNEDGVEANPPKPRLRLILPNSSCGGIIGKGGSTIKSFIESSQAGIKISPQDNNFLGLTDRLVTVTGSLDEQIRAVDLILSKLMEDSHYGHSSTGPFLYAGSNYNAINFVPNGGGRNFYNNKVDQSSSITIGVADEHIGVVVGRGGKNISEISQISGARIKISDRNDFVSGTSDRKVTITGTQRAIRVAEAMITHKIASISERIS